MHQGREKTRRRFLGLAAVVTVGVGVGIAGGVFSLRRLMAYRRRKYAALLVWRGRSLDLSRASSDFIERIVERKLTRDDRPRLAKQLISPNRQVIFEMPEVRFRNCGFWSAAEGDDI